MAQLIIDIPNAANATRILNAICTRHGYNVVTDGTKADFVKGKLITWLKTEAAAHEAGTAAAAATNTATNDVNAIPIS